MKIIERIKLFLTPKNQYEVLLYALLKLFKVLFFRFLKLLFQILKNYVSLIIILYGLDYSFKTLGFEKTLIFSIGVIMFIGYRLVSDFEHAFRNPK